MEIANIASECEGSNLAAKAKVFIQAEKEFKSALDNIGFELG